MGAEVRSLRCKGKEDKGSHKDWSRNDLRADIFVNRVKIVEEVVAPIDLYSN